MLFPVRCFSCSKFILPYYRPYVRREAEGEQAGDILDSVDIRRLCCRRMFITHVRTIETHSLGGRSSFEDQPAQYVKIKSENAQPISYDAIL